LSLEVKLFNPVIQVTSQKWFGQCSKNFSNWYIHETATDPIGWFCAIRAIFTGIQQQSYYVLGWSSELLKKKCATDVYQ